jgi:hypothetical protein
MALDTIFTVSPGLVVVLAAEMIVGHSAVCAVSTRQKTLSTVLAFLSMLEFGANALTGCTTGPRVEEELLSHQELNDCSAFF